MATQTKYPQMNYKVMAEMNVLVLILPWAMSWTDFVI